MAYVNATRSTHASFGDRIAAAVADLKDGLRRRRIYKQTVRELNGLTSRELADLGIHRAMITRIALEAAYGPTR